MSVNEKQVGGDHYKSSLQHWDFVGFNRIPYMEAMALKYVTRSRKKNGLEDIQKAIHFVEKMLQPEIPFSHASVNDYVRANQLDEDEAAVVRLLVEYSENPSDNRPLWAAYGRLAAMAVRLSEKP